MLQGTDLSCKLFFAYSLKEKDFFNSNDILYGVYIYIYVMDILAQKKKSNFQIDYYVKIKS